MLSSLEEVPPLEFVLLSSVDAPFPLEVVSELLSEPLSPLDATSELSLSFGVEVEGLELPPGFPPLELSPLGLDVVVFSL